MKALIKNAGTSPTKSTPPGFHVKMSEKGEIDDIFSDIPPSSPNPNTHPSPSSPLRSSEHNSQKLLPSNELIQHPQEHLQTVSKHRHNSQAKFPLNNIPHFLNPIPSLVTVAFKRIPTTRAPVQHDINSKYSGEDGSDHDKGSHEYDYNEEDNVESEDDKENHSKQHQNVRHQSQSEQLHDVHQNTRPKSTLHAVSLSRDLADYHSNDQRDHISNHKDHGQLKYIHLEKPISFTVPLPFHGEQHSSPQLQTKLASSPSQPILRVNPNQMSSTERPEKIPPRQPPYWHQRAPFSRLSTSMDRRPPPFTNHENHEGSISSLSAQPSHRVLG